MPTQLVEWAYGAWSPFSWRAFLGADAKAPQAFSAGTPGHAFQEVAGRDRQRASELDHGVYARQPHAPLKLSDLSSVKRGPKAQLFLGEIGTLAGNEHVQAELLGDFLARLHHLSLATTPPRRDSNPNSASCSAMISA